MQVIDRQVGNIYIYIQISDRLIYRELGRQIGRYVDRQIDRWMVVLIIIFKIDENLRDIFYLTKLKEVYNLESKTCKKIFLT